MKLEELRVEHMTNEASSESIISCLNDKLSEVNKQNPKLDKSAKLQAEVISIIFF